ncbi:MAG TPA: beta-galactosidase, partial [Methylomirabilota bacterium]|nr:beta-galactosidase [Methylomirabilota bacterium]
MTSTRTIAGALLLAVLLLALPQANAQNQNPLPTQIPQRDAILVGTAWYPEQWPESRWEADLRLMEEANIKVVRV